MRTWDEYKKTMSTEATLFSAAKEGDLRLLTKLLYGGAKVNEVDHRGYSPLMLAVYAGQIEAAQLLLDVGADPNSADFGGNSILMGAAFKGHSQLVNLLLESGADPGVKNLSGLSAFDFAVTFGRADVAEKLKPLVGDQAKSRVATFLRIFLSRFSSRSKGAVVGPKVFRTSTPLQPPSVS